MLQPSNICSYPKQRLEASKQHAQQEQGLSYPVMQVLYLQLLRLQAAGLVCTPPASAIVTGMLGHRHLQDCRTAARRAACMQDHHLPCCHFCSVWLILLCAELGWLCSFRQILEPLLYKYGVDLVYNGHVRDCACLCWLQALQGYCMLQVQVHRTCRTPLCTSAVHACEHAFLVLSMDKQRVGMPHLTISQHDRLALFPGALL